MQQKVRWQQAMLVSVFAGFLVGLLTAVYFSLRFIPLHVHAGIWLFVLIHFGLGVFDLKFPGFKLALLNQEGDDITAQRWPRFIALWGFVWRIAVCWPVLPIGYGLVGAVFISMMMKFPLLVSSVVPFALWMGMGSTLLLFPFIFWWTRMYGMSMRMVALDSSAA